MNFKEMAVGKEGKVAGFEEGGRSYRKKLLAMGLTPGTTFSVTRVAPMGDPVEIRVRGFKLSLRKDEASAFRSATVSTQSHPSSSLPGRRTWRTTSPTLMGAVAIIYSRPGTRIPSAGETITSSKSPAASSTRRSMFRAKYARCSKPD